MLVPSSISPPMAADALTSDALVARFSCRSSDMVRWIIHIEETNQPTETTATLRTHVSSSIGSLDTLPVELLHIICNSLDFRSLSRFARVCHRAKSIVESLSSYQRITKHASAALIALKRTDIIKFHTGATIHAALLSDECVSCQQFGPFLFLPTCERCCYWCLKRERSLRVITPRTAGICFGVSRADLKEHIPLMINIPGSYRWGHVVRPHRRARLVSVKQAEEVGISVHRSREAMARVSVM